MMRFCKQQQYNLFKNIIYLITWSNFLPFRWYNSSVCIWFLSPPNISWIWGGVLANKRTDLFIVIILSRGDFEKTLSVMTLPILNQKLCVCECGLWDRTQEWANDQDQMNLISWSEISCQNFPYSGTNFSMRIFNQSERRYRCVRAVLAHAGCSSNPL